MFPFVFKRTANIAFDLLLSRAEGLTSWINCSRQLSFLQAGNTALAVSGLRTCVSDASSGWVGALGIIAVPSGDLC